MPTMGGTVKILTKYDSGCVVLVKFSDCMKRGFIARFPQENERKLKLEIEDQPNMPLFINEFPDNWYLITEFDCSITTRA